MCTVLASSDDNVRSVTSAHGLFETDVEGSSCVG